MRFGDTDSRVLYFNYRFAIILFKTDGDFTFFCIFDGALAGNVVTAMTGIEIAFWDLVGKAVNLPVYQLLGGKFRNKAPFNRSF